MLAAVAEQQQGPPSMSSLALLSQALGSRGRSGSSGSGSREEELKEQAAAASGQEGGKAHAE